jgi:hypothetical protein
MHRKISAYFIASNDPNFETSSGKVTLLAPDITVELDNNEHEWVFRSPRKLITNDYEAAIIDISTCSRVTLAILDRSKDTELPPEFLASASFLEVIRALMGG